MLIRACDPAEVPALLGGALDGEYALAPCPEQSVDWPPGGATEVPDGIMMVLPTSGSTSQPKAVLLSRAALLASAAATRQRLNGGFTWHCALSSAHIAGVQVWLRGLLDARDGLGLGVQIVGPQLGGLSLAPGRNAISIVPTQLYRALRQPDIVTQLARFDAVLLGGAPVPADQLVRARQAGVPIVTTYGMTETCGGCVYDGRPLPGVRIEVLDPDFDGVGRIGLGGPVAFSGYLGDPASTAEALCGDLVRTTDFGCQDADGQLTVLGRLDDVVISGGVNVNLAAVQQMVDALARRPAAVFASPDPEWGQRVVLAVTDPDDVGIQWWREQLGQRLPRAWLPQQVVALDVLPQTVSGKIDRRALQAQLCRSIRHKVE